MQKQKLFIDFDDTISESSKSIISLYNQMYKDYPNFKPANHEVNNEWDYSVECPYMKGKSLEMFENPYFFLGLELFPQALNVLKELDKKYELIIVSIGSYSNIELKSYFIKGQLSFIQNAVLISNKGCKMDKSIVNMKDGIFIDDVSSNLFSSNAERKICFIPYGFKKWSQDWQGETASSWVEISNKLL